MSSKRNNQYDAFIVFEILDFFYFLCNNTHLVDPPDISLNNILPPNKFTLTANDADEQIFIDIEPIYQRPMYLMIEVSRFKSPGTWTNNSWTILYCKPYDPVKDARLILQYYVPKSTSIVSYKKVYIGLRFVCPLSGFHTLNYFDYCLVTL
jgi:hypothetical protein